jgi:hypothetical protein
MDLHPSPGHLSKGNLMPKNRKSPVRGKGGSVPPKPQGAQSFDRATLATPALPKGPRVTRPVILPLRLPGKGRGG